MRRRSVGAVLTVVTCTMLGGGVTLAPPAGAVPTATHGGSQRVIALLRDQHSTVPANRTRFAQRRQLLAGDQAPIRDRVRQLGGTTTHAYQSLNALALTLPADRIAALRSDPRVAAVVPDLNRSISRQSMEQAQRAATRAAAAPAPGTCPSDPAKPILEPEALQTTHTSSDDPRALTARSLGYTGAGVKVAFIADGIDPNNKDFTRADGTPVFSDYQDFSGDGPNSPSSGAEAYGDASSIASQGRGSYDLANYVNPAHPLPPGCNIRIEGFAPGSTLVGLKIFPNALLTAPTSVIIQAIDYAVSHDHVDVINESFGANPYPDTALDPVSVFNHDAVQAGVTVVASSGDAGIGSTIGTAASDPFVIAVGASTTLRSYAQETAFGFQLGNGHWVSNQVSALSSAGISQTNRVQDLLAPGDLGWALCSGELQPDGTQRFPGCSDNKGAPSDIQNFGGTSQSAPFTAGAAALVIQSYRNAHAQASPTPDQVRQVLDSSADDLGLPAAEQGAGLLNTYRAVQLAASLHSATPQGQGLSASVPQLSRVATAGSAVTSQVVVRNDGKGSQQVTAGVRQLVTRTDGTGAVVPLDAAGARTFIDSGGRIRAYTLQTFSVPPGTDLLKASISYPGDASKLVRMSLLDPKGTFTGYTLPQGLGDFGEFEVHQPATGTWTAIIWTAHSAAGYSGPVTLRTNDIAATPAGTVSPATFSLAQGESRTVTVTTTAPAQQATATSLVLAGRFRQTTTVPLVVRAVQAVRPGQSTGFSGVFANGNGRSFGPAQTDTFLFDVPAGAKDLDVNLALGGVPPNQVIAHLSDPSGEPVSTDTSYRPSGTATKAYPGLQIVHARPVAGRYQLTVELLNPVSGAPLPQIYRGSVTLDRAHVTAVGIPNGRVVRGRPMTGSVTVYNTSPQPQSYYLDGRSDVAQIYNLTPVGPSTVALPLQSEDVPSWLVPTRTRKLTVGASATAPLEFDVMALDNPTALNAPSSPDVEATPSGNTATAVHSASEVVSSLWGAFPSLVGPTSGQETGSVTMAARAVADGFDRAYTSSTGDPLLATIDPKAPAAHPVLIPAGGHATIRFTLTTLNRVGSKINGHVYINTLSPYGPQGQAGLGDEVAALPYTYTVT